MDNTEKLSRLQSGGLPIPDGVKILTGVEVLQNNDLSFSFSDGSSKTIPRVDITYVGRSIQSVTYGTLGIAFLLSSGDTIDITFNDDFPLNRNTVPYIKSATDFKRVLLGGRLKLAGSVFTYTTNKLNAAKSLSVRTTGNDTSLTIPGEAWTKAIINQGHPSLPEYVLSDGSITLPPGVWYVVGNVVMSTASLALCQGVARIYDPNNDVVLAYSSATDKSATGTGLGGAAAFNQYIYLPETTTFQIDRYSTAQTAIHYTNDGSTWYVFLSLNFVLNE